MLDGVTIRPFRSGDRAAVRDICFRTGYMGEPADWLWRDADSFADMFSAYYTDREPESALVAELDGEVAGYLLGCVDTARVGHPLAPLAPHLLRRGLLFRPGTAPVLWRSIRDIAVDAAHRRLPPASAADPRWPAHLHIDLLPVARGGGVGSALMRRWLGSLSGAGIAGCHLETFAENHAAIAFFERMGFRRHGAARPVPGMRTRAGGRHHVQVMVQELVR